MRRFVGPPVQTLRFGLDQDRTNAGFAGRRALRSSAWHDARRCRSSSASATGSSRPSSPWKPRTSRSRRPGAGSSRRRRSRASRPPPYTCSAMDGWAVRAADVAGACRLEVATAAIYAGDAPPASLRPGTRGADLHGRAAPARRGRRGPRGGDAARGRPRALRGRRSRGRERAARGRGRRARRPRARGRGPARCAPARASRRGRRRGAAGPAAGARRGPLHRGRGGVRAHARLERRRGRRARLGARARRGAGDGSRSPRRRRCRRSRRRSSRPTRSSPSAACRSGSAITSPPALARLGADVRVHGVPMKPGKPFLFALARGTPVFGLPGSPSACLAAFEVFARPALLARAGAARRERAAVPVELAEAVQGRAGRARLLWATLEPGGRARPLGRDAAQIRGPALADALLLVPADAGDLPEGAEVTAWLLDDDGRRVARHRSSPVLAARRARGRRGSSRGSSPRSSSAACGWAC